MAEIELVERDTVPGDIIETPNGNRYLVLPKGRQAYIGNRKLHLSEGLVEVRPEGPCRLLTSIGLPKYV